MYPADLRFTITGLVLYTLNDNKEFGRIPSLFVRYDGEQIIYFPLPETGNGWRISQNTITRVY
jgi:hypothetical protein